MLELFFLAVAWLVVLVVYINVDGRFIPMSETLRSAVIAICMGAFVGLGLLLGTWLPKLIG